MQDLGPSVCYLKYRVNLTLQPEAHNLQMQLSQNLHSNEKNDLQQFHMESGQPIKTEVSCLLGRGVDLPLSKPRWTQRGEREKNVGGRRKEDSESSVLDLDLGMRSWAVTSLNV